MISWKSIEINIINQYNELIQYIIIDFNLHNLLCYKRDSAMLWMQKLVIKAFGVAWAACW